MPLVVQVKFDELHIFIHNVDAALAQQVNALTAKVKEHAATLQDAVTNNIPKPTGD